MKKRQIQIEIEEQEIDVILDAITRLTYQTEDIIELWEKDTDAVPEYLQTRYAKLKDIRNKLLKLSLSSL